MLIIILMLFSANAQAIEPTQETLRVVYKAAKKYNIDAQDMIRIAYVESRFKANAQRVNTNGTIDYGMFQINSVHWTTTCKRFNVMTLRGNAECAALIISKIKKEHGETDEHWLGRYHSKTPSKKLKYSEKLADVPNFVKE